MEDDRMERVLEFSIYIDGKPDAVWHALTSPEGTKAIFFGSTLKSSFEVGADYAYVGPGADGDETVHVYGKFLAFEPGKRMSYTEHPGPSYRENHAELGTRVTITLSEVGSTTKLTLVNDQWPDHHPGFDHAKDVWSMILSSLKTYVETGKSLNFGGMEA
jgi:uncharacterized protein YndB with AHSA1/START domain